MVKWWPFGRRRKNQASLPTVSKPESPSSRISRRALLKWGAAAAGLGIVGHSVFRDYKEYEKKIQQLQNEPHILTSTKTKEKFERENQPFSHAYPSLREAIEHWPDIKTLEMGWYKQKGKPGQMRRADEKRDWGSVLFLREKEGDISTLHTHNIKGWEKIPSKLVSQLLSRVSEQDICATVTGYIAGLRESAFSKNAPIISTCHSAVLNSEGKVIGYCTLKLGRRLTGGDLVDLLEKSNNNGELLLKAIQAGDWNDLERVKRSTSALLEKYRKKGLLIHNTPAPGYVFKDGSFQKKA
jgi:hypothetical protein